MDVERDDAWDDVELAAESLGCASTCTISGAAESTSTLKFTGVKVVKPRECTLGNPGKTAGTIATNLIHGQVMPNPKEPSGPPLEKFVPATGAKWLEVEFHGALCALDELAIPIEGSAIGEFAYPLGFEKVEPTLKFGKAQQEAGGGALTLGGGAVVFGGTSITKLSGTGAGKAFGAAE